jgi:hypothetical protein
MTEASWKQVLGTLVSGFTENKKQRHPPARGFK